MGERMGINYKMESASRRLRLVARATFSCKVCLTHTLPARVFTAGSPS